MAEISDKDWGRIYAFIWREHRKGNSSYKNLFEKNPMKAIEKIHEALEQEKPGNGITYTTILNVGSKPTDVTDAQLDEIIKGEVVAFLQVRLTC